MDAHIEKLVAALDRHSAALEKFVGAAGKGTAGTTAGAAAGTTKPGTTKPGTTKPKFPTTDEVQAKFTAFMSTTDKEERARRRDIVLAIAGHFGAAKATEIEEAKRKEAFDMLDLYADENDPQDPLGLFGEPGEEAEGDSPI